MQRSAAERRKRVEALYGTMTRRQIAETLAVPMTAVENDIHWLRKAQQDEQRAAIEADGSAVAADWTGGLLSLRRGVASRCSNG